MMACTLAAYGDSLSYATTQFVRDGGSWQNILSGLDWRFASYDFVLKGYEPGRKGNRGGVRIASAGAAPPL